MTRNRLAKDSSSRQPDAIASSELERNRALLDGWADRMRAAGLAGDRVRRYAVRARTVLADLLGDSRQFRIGLDKLQIEMRAEAEGESNNVRARATRLAKSRARVRFNDKLYTVLDIQSSVGYVVSLVLMDDEGERIRRVPPFKVQEVSKLEHPAPDPLPKPKTKSHHGKPMNEQPGAPAAEA